MSVPNNPRRTLATLAPKTASDFLQRVPTGFAAFISDVAYAAYVERILGAGNDPARLFKDLRVAPPHCTSRGAFKKWTANVWLPRTVNPVKRGRAYWARIASIVWSIYADTIALRYRTKIAIKKDVERLAHADQRRRKKMLAARARRKARKAGVA